MFEHLKKLEVADKMAWVKMPEVGPRARIRVRFAGQSNAAYFNAKLKLAAARPATKVPAEMLALIRETERQLYPRYIICEFDNVPDAEGNPVVYSVTAARDLVACLPDWLFDRIRDDASEPAKFLPEDESPAEPAQDLIPS